jgi:hypothetical protein
VATRSHRPTNGATIARAKIATLSRFTRRGGGEKHRHAECSQVIVARTHIDERTPSGRLGGLAKNAGNGVLPPPELSLMRAVLQDAILCFMGRAKRRRVDPRILAREADHWIRINDWESPFSFNNVCEALGLSHESTRRTILAWRDDPDRRSRNPLREHTLSRAAR